MGYYYTIVTFHNPRKRNYPLDWQDKLVVGPFMQRDNAEKCACSAVTVPGVIAIRIVETESETPTENEQSK